jgi:5'-nucleotidase (lipoprotein e(P4) family)
MKPLFLVFTVMISLAEIASAQDTLSVGGMSNAKLLPVLWQQHSAEYRALCYQAFNFATCRLEESRLRKRHRYAIITDVDETVLDNSYYEAKRVLQNTEFDMTTWKQWTSQAVATPLPGAVEFFQMARKKGVEIFYVSNRDTSEVSSTIANLKRHGFPDADRKHMLFLGKTSSKEERRQIIFKDYKVIMMLGDNLNDFSAVFEKKDSQARKVETDNHQKEWGSMFIVLPNVIYGEWENALLDYSRSRSPVEKEIRLRDKLVTTP